MDRYEVEDILGEFKFCKFRGKDGTIPYRLHIPDGGAEGAPVVLFMHGAGERGTDNTLPLRAALDVFTKCNPETKEAVFIVPQCPRDETWVNYPWDHGSYSIKEIDETWELKGVVKLLKFNVRKLKADADRIYVMGLSMGGFATWDLIARHGELFAAAMPICGSGDPSMAEKIKDIPIHAFHGEVDDTVPARGSREMVEALKAVGGNIEYTEFPGIGHWSWDLACSYPDIGKWMFSHRLSDRQA